MDMAEIGANIRSCRTEKDMTMEELGKAIGKSQSAVADYEKGRVDIPASSLIKIAEVLEVHPAKLFGMQTADEQFKPDATLRIFSAEDRRTIAGILVMNGYTTRHIKVAREGKKSRPKYSFAGNLLTEYECMQKQREYERAVREYKRILAAYDSYIQTVQSEADRAYFREEFQKESVKLKEKESQMKDFCKQSLKKCDGEKMCVLRQERIQMNFRSRCLFLFLRS